MSYNYSVNPVVSIAGDELQLLKYALGVTRDDDVVKALDAQGFTSFVEFAPGEDGYYVAHVDVVHFGKVNEREGIDGVVKAFRKFIDFTGGRVSNGDYTLTDENGNSEVITVG